MVRRADSIRRRRDRGDQCSRRAANGYLRRNGNGKQAGQDSHGSMGSVALLCEGPRIFDARTVAVAQGPKSSVNSWIRRLSGSSASRATPSRPNGARAGKRRFASSPMIDQQIVEISTIETKLFSAGMFAQFFSRQMVTTATPLSTNRKLVHVEISPGKGQRN